MQFVGADEQIADMGSVASGQSLAPGLTVRNDAGQSPKAVRRLLPNGAAFELLGIPFIACVVYCLALRFVFPGFLRPLEPFHSDFFDYVATAGIPITQIAATYPRPVAFLAMHFLGRFGVPGLMAAEVGLCIAAILLLRLFVRQAFNVTGNDFWRFTLFASLVFAQPDFYFEYRHDLPYLVELLLFASASLVSLYAIRSGSRLAIPVAIALAIASCLAKEALYVAGPAFLVLVALIDRKHRQGHLAAACVLIFIEAACRQWSTHLGASFAGSSDPGAPYYVSLAFPGLLLRLIRFMGFSFTPVAAAVIAFTTLTAKSRRTAIGLEIVGLLVMVPYAVLPNHAFEEYAWAATPFCFAPILLNIPKIAGKHIEAIVACIAILALVLMQRSPDASALWTLNQERITTHIFLSESALESMPSNSTVLIFGPHDARFALWDVPGYVKYAFHNNAHFDVFDPSTPRRRGTGQLSFGGLDSFDVSTVDHVASYSSDGTLSNVRLVPRTSCRLRAAATLFPPLSAWVVGCELRKPDLTHAKDELAVLSSIGAWNEVTTVAKLFPNLVDAEKALTNAQRHLVDDAPSGTISNDPLVIISRNGYGSSEVAWTSNAGEIEIHAGSANGPLVARSTADGHQKLDGWLTDRTHLVLIATSWPRQTIDEDTIRVTTPSGIPWSDTKLYIEPNPVKVDPKIGTTSVTLTWNYPAAKSIQLRLGSPIGPLVASGGSMGTTTTPSWIKGGEHFFLQDVSHGSPGATITQAVIQLSR